MIICKKCGAELDDGSRFCSQCGVNTAETGSMRTGAYTDSAVPANSRYCCKCGAKLPESCVSCIICGADEGAPPPDEPEPESEPPVEKSPIAQKASIRKHPVRLTVICVSICALLALSAASLWVVQYFPYLSSNAVMPARDAIIYLTGDGRLKYKSPSAELPQDIVRDYHADTKISGQALAKASPNGRYIAYLNGYSTVNGIASGQLLVRDFAQKPPVDSPEIVDLLVSEHVTSGFFFAENSVALVFLTSDGMLYITDFVGSRLLDEGVSEIIDHTETQVLYSKKSGEALSVYLNTDITADRRIHVGDNIISLSDYTSAFDKFIYLCENPDGSRDAVSYDAKLDKLKPLAVGIDGIIAADARVSAVLYQTSTPNTLHYYNLIDDVLAKADEKIKEPELSDYPLLNEFIDRYGVDADYEGSLEYEEIVEERARFQSDMDIYFEKAARDHLRDEINGIIEDFVAVHPLLYDLHLTRDGVTTKLAGVSYRPFDNAELDIDKGFSVWQTTSLKIQKKIPFAQYSDTFSASTLLDYLYDGMSDNLYLQQLGYVQTPVSLGNGQFYSTGWQLDAKGDGIYFAMGDGRPFGYSDNACKLYYAPIQNGLAGTIIQVDENVAEIGPMLSGNRLLYYKDRLGTSCDLYIFSGGSSAQIGSDISLQDEFFKIENDGKTLLYCEHFDDSAEAGNMFMLSKQNRQLATSVHRVFYRNDLFIYFLRSFKDGKAELYSFGSDGLVHVDDNVIAVME